MIEQEHDKKKPAIIFNKIIIKKLAILLLFIFIFSIGVNLEENDLFVQSIEAQAAKNNVTRPGFGSKDRNKCKIIIIMSGNGASDLFEIFSSLKNKILEESINLEWKSISIYRKALSKFSGANSIEYKNTLKRYYHTINIMRFEKIENSICND